MQSFRDLLVFDFAFHREKIRYEYVLTHVYAAFLWKNYASSWNSSQPLQEQRFREVAGKDSYWPFTIALDQNGTLWMTVFDTNREKPSQKLLKAAVGAKSYMFEAPPE
ncbi:uncharacterized protein LOC135935872 [Cloeon dipterum]|uniref:uncharacterized protein LOC135935872 n=1 Tax=Cloeon dipterum TaxID=197152 RepID=UPI00321FA785